MKDKPKKSKKVFEPGLLNSDSKIRSGFEEVEGLFQRYAAENVEELEASKIKPFHSELFPYSQNGIHLMIATVGSGKTYNYLKLAAKQQYIKQKDVLYDLVVICSTSGEFDKTVKAYKDVITKSKLVHVKDSELLTYLSKYMKRILKFNGIYEMLKSQFTKVSDEMVRVIGKHNLKNPIDEQQKMKPKDKLKLLKYLMGKIEKYNWKLRFPHRMLLIMDDFAAHPLLRTKEAEMSRLLKKLRHFNINVILCVQTVASVPKDIRRLAHDVSLFPGMSTEDLKILFRNGPFAIFDEDKLIDIYKKLKPQNMMTIHIGAGKVVVS